MADTYNDEQNQRPILQQASPAAVTTPAQTSVWDWVKKNRAWVLLGILILIALIWWFCLRKDKKAGASSNVSTTINVPASNPASTTVVKPAETLKLTKMRGNNNAY
jgi:hypothetical protein